VVCNSWRCSDAYRIWFIFVIFFPVSLMTYLLVIGTCAGRGLRWDAPPILAGWARNDKKKQTGLPLRSAGHAVWVRQNLSGQAALQQRERAFEFIERRTFAK